MAIISMIIAGISIVLHVTLLPNYMQKGIVWILFEIVVNGLVLFGQYKRLPIFYLPYLVMKVIVLDLKKITINITRVLFVLMVGKVGCREAVTHSFTRELGFSL